MAQWPMGMGDVALAGSAGAYDEYADPFFHETTGGKPDDHPPVPEKKADADDDRPNGPRIRIHIRMEVNPDVLKRILIIPHCYDKLTSAGDV